jgi:hypothetical protein
MESRIQHHPNPLHGSCRFQSKLLTVEVCVVSSIQFLLTKAFIISSGTSYTLALVHSVTNLSLATNYGKEASQNGTIDPLPVFEDQPQGPFWLNTGGEKSGPGYLLTKVSWFAHHYFSGIIKLILKTSVPHANIDPLCRLLRWVQSITTTTRVRRVSNDVCER